MRQVTQPLYRMILATFLGLLAAMTQAADQFITEASPEQVAGATTIGNAEAKELFDQGVLFVDVRSQKAFDKGRIPDALLLDLKTQFNQEALAAEAKTDAPIAFYCQGPKCGRAAVAAEKALAWGYQQVYYYREGFPGWKKAGYPVE
jgi:rhodanese-related sulfurtransferase